jgi:hypothetical protein
MTTALSAGSEFIANLLTAGHQQSPTITALEGGGYAIAWVTSDATQDGSLTAIKVRLYASDGTPDPNEILVNSEVADYQVDPSVVALDDGGFVVVWMTNDGTQDGSGSALKARVFDAGGEPVAPEFLVNEQSSQGQREASAALLSDGRFLVTWRDLDTAQDGSFSSIKARVFNPDGSESISEFIVNSFGLNNQYSPVATALDDGRFAIAWTSNSSPSDAQEAIRARTFNADGSEAAAEFQVNQHVAGAQAGAAIATVDGRLVLTWWSNDSIQDGSGLAIKGAVFNADGSPYVAEFLVNSATASDQMEPALADLGNGTFVVVWITTDGTQDGDSWALKGRVFNADGTEAVPEFLVNELPAGEPHFVQVASNGAGGFLATWQISNAPGDGNGESISARLFETQDINVAPNAADDSATVAEDTPITFSASQLLANDSDGDGDALAISSVGNAANGTVALGEDGAVTFTPDANFNGTASFTYRVSDGLAESGDATVTIEVTAVDDPLAAQASSVTLDEDTVHIFAASEFVIADPDTGAAATLSFITITSLPAEGELSFNGQVLSAGDVAGGFVVTSADLSAGKLQFTPDPDQSGDGYAAFSFTANSTGTTGLLAAWTFEGDSKDISGMGHHLVLQGGAALTSGGHVGRGVDVNGAPGSGLVSSSVDTDFGTDNFSVQLWVKFDSFTHETTLIEDFTGAAGPGWTLTMRAQNDLLFATPVGTFHATGLAPVSLGTWHQFVVTRSGSQFALYADGVQVGSLVSNMSIPSSGGPLLIGGRNAGDGRNFTLDGQVDDVTIWSRGLTAAEVSRHWNAGANLTVASPAATMTIDVTSVNDAPVAAEDTASTLEDTPVTIDAATLIGNGSDAEGDALQVASVGGAVNGTVAFDDDGNVVFTPTADFHGSASFVYTLTDGEGASNEATVTVTVEPVEDVPVAAADSVATGEDTPLTIAAATLLGNDGDADGDTITIASVGNAVNGTVALNGDGDVVFTPDTNFNGVASFTYTITDGDDVSDEVTVTVDVNPVDDLPFAHPSSVSLDEDEPYEFSPADFNVIDVDDGQAYGVEFITILGIPAAGTLLFDGTALTAGDVANGFVVTADDLTAGRLTFMPDADGNGPDYAEFPFSANAVGTIGLVAAWTFEGSGTDASGNEHDVALEGTATYAAGLRGQGLELDGAQGSAAVGGADLDSDFDGDDFSVVVWANFDSLNGEATLIEDFNLGGGPGWTLTLAEGYRLQFFVGPTFNVTYAPPPIALDTWHQFAVTRSGDSFNLYYDGQKLGDTIMFPDAVIDPGPGNLLIGARNGSDQRNFTVDGTLDDISIWSRGLSATEIAVHWNQGAGMPLVTTPSAPMSISVIPVNDEPVAGGVTLAPMAEDTSRLITALQLLAGVDDVDGPTATITALSIASGGGALVDHGNGTWTYMPVANFDGAATFDYTVSDGTLSASGTASLDITPVNDAPVAAVVTLAALAEDTTRFITSAELLAGVSDIDGPAATVTALSIASGGGALTNNSNGTWTYTPAANFDGAASFAYTASDGALSASSTASLDITPVNDAPSFDGSIAPAGTVTTSENAKSVVNLAGSDVEGDTLGFAIQSGADSGLFTINAVTGQLSFRKAPDFEVRQDANADGVYEVVVSLSDGQGTALKALAVTVGDVDGNTVAGTRKDDKVSLSQAANGKKATTEEDRIDGKKGDDQLNGAGGNDTLIGGEGKDTLTGGGGSDSFRFNVKLAAANADKVTDFARGVDTIELDDAIFKKIGASLDAREFYAKSGATSAHDKDDRIIYDKKTGILYYDSDGKGGEAAIQFATLSSKPAIGAEDFSIV